MNPVEDGDSVPQEILDAAGNISSDLLPDKSKKKYMDTYEKFTDWKKEKNLTSTSEAALLVYFSEMLRLTKLSASTLWSHHSMLKKTLNIYENVDISTYEKVNSYLKKQNKGYRPKKSKIFTAEEISKYCNEAPDLQYLTYKVILIVGFSGGLRREEIYHLTTDHVSNEGNNLLFRIPKTKNDDPKSFIIVGELCNCVKKYRALHPGKLKNFFVAYQNGKCKNQVMGINKIGSIPKQIAEFLELPNPELYTGHSFRRTAATLLVDAGADITELKRFGGWKSTSVAEGYLGESMNNKKRTYAKLTESLAIKPSFSNTEANLLPEIPPSKRGTAPVENFAASTSATLSLDKENSEPPTKGTCVFQFSNYCTVNITTAVD